VPGAGVPGEADGVRGMLTLRRAVTFTAPGNRVTG
jgi:hypothetical protein